MKKFLILGGNIAPNIKDVFELMMKNRISVGYIYDKSLTFECESGTKKLLLDGILHYQYSVEE